MGDSRIYNAKVIHDHDKDKEKAHDYLKSLYPFDYCPFCGEKIKEVEE